MMKSTLRFVWLCLFISVIRSTSSLTSLHSPLIRPSNPASFIIPLWLTPPFYRLDALGFRCGTTDSDELTLVLGVEAEIQSLTDTLRSVRDVLEDAERRQVKEKSVQGWLERLKDMAYQMDERAG
ncbi:hypothetical protein CK203_102480 [Vitis vinifera]|uniref:Disease resistance N-terminal domain-containing protein n=1 Tax=Vitis vinifera TaxID=29760 RepID=A0A438C6P8_VITVI|nr:hypothetical protein CK203_102480 [Vitis vinifera]